MSEIIEETPSLIVTDNAAVKVKALMKEEGNMNLHLRVYITGGGCSGFQYGFAFEEQEEDDDIQVLKDDVSFIVDPMSVQYLEGAEVDYLSGLEEIGRASCRERV